MRRLIAFFPIILILCFPTLAFSDTSILHFKAIEKLTGKKGRYDSIEKNFRIIVPRNDLKIQMNGMNITPEMGVSSWVAFNKNQDSTSVIGELVLSQDQINPVMSTALKNSLEVKGLHDIYLWDSPRILNMHFTGTGDEYTLARAVGRLFQQINNTSNGKGELPVGSFEGMATHLNTHRIDSLLGTKGFYHNNIYTTAFRLRPDVDLYQGVMAKHSWVAFSGTDNQAAVNGNLVVRESELQKVLMILRKADFNIMAIYELKLAADLDVISINYWGIGNAKSLARTIKKAFFIAQTKSPFIVKSEPAIQQAISEIEINRIAKPFTLTVIFPFIKTDRMCFFKK